MNRFFFPDVSFLHTFSVLVGPGGAHRNAWPAVTLWELLGRPGVCCGGCEVASLLPRVVFQLVVVVQTVIAVVGSWPVTADLTALGVTGTFSKRNDNNT